MVSIELRNVSKAFDTIRFVEDENSDKQEVSDVPPREKMEQWLGGSVNDSI